MDRRDFIKKGIGLVGVAASTDATATSGSQSTTPVASVSTRPQEYESESSIVSEDELDIARKWYSAITGSSNIELAGAYLDEWLATDLPFSFRYGGGVSRSVLAQWPRHQEEGGNREGDDKKIWWKDPASGLQVSWHIKRFPEFPAIEWTLWFENAGDRDTLLIEDIQDLDLKLNRSTEDQFFILHGADGGRYKRDDWWPFSRYLPSAVSKGLPDYENSKEFDIGGAYPSSRRTLPFFNIESSEGHGAVVGVGWTGNWTGHFEVDTKRLIARAGLKETRFVLHPNEQLRTARILVLLWNGKHLHGQNMLRRLLYTNYIPYLKGKPREPLLSLNTCFGHHGQGAFLEKANENNLVPDVQPFLEMGGEAFIIDAGWYCTKAWDQGMGDWRYSTEKYPNGFDAISAPLKAANRDFGLWFAPEIINPGAPILEQHPEWVRPSPKEDYLNKGGGVLRLELAEARQWFLSQVEELIEHQGVTLYRQDGCNHESDLRLDESDNRKGIREIQYITGLYAMEDELRRRNPHLIMEAALGAPRIDLETISRFHWHQPCESWLHPALDQCQTYGIGMWLPGGSLVFYNEATDTYGLWSGFGGQLSVAWEPTDSNFPMEWAQKQIAVYKRIRPFLSGDFYPLTPISLENRWLGYQFHRVDLHEGCAFVFKRPDSSQITYLERDTFSLQLNGLVPGQRYQVQYHSAGKETVLTGRQLAIGVDLVLGKAPAAELVAYQAVA
jgi:alpha-galactosidase